MAQLTFSLRTLHRAAEGEPPPRHWAQGGFGGHTLSCTTVFASQLSMETQIPSSFNSWRLVDFLLKEQLILASSFQSEVRSTDTIIREYF